MKKGMYNDLSLADKTTLKNAQECINTNSRKRAETLTKTLHDMWAKFYTDSPYNERGLYMNYSTLGEAAQAFCEDVLRLKAYHDIEYSDRHKQAAHLFKWLSRMRPIKPYNDHASTIEEHLLRANAYFSLFCAQAFLEATSFSEAENRYIAYASMFRDIHAREWSMIFYLLEKIHPKA